MAVGNRGFGGSGEKYEGTNAGINVQVPKSMFGGGGR
jgi:hypothetical protein